MNSCNKLRTSKSHIEIVEYLNVASDNAFTLWQTESDEYGKENRNVFLVKIKSIDNETDALILEKHEEQKSVLKLNTEKDAFFISRSQDFLAKTKVQEIKGGNLYMELPKNVMLIEKRTSERKNVLNEGISVGFRIDGRLFECTLYDFSFKGLGMAVRAKDIGAFDLGESLNIHQLMNKDLPSALNAKIRHFSYLTPTVFTVGLEFENMEANPDDDDQQLLFKTIEILYEAL